MTRFAFSPSMVALVAASLIFSCSEQTPIPTPPGPNTTVYVDAAAAAGGDGSLANPFQTVREAFEVERPIDRIVVAGGSYEVPASWTFADDLAILSTDTVTFSAEGGEARIAWDTSGELSMTHIDFASALDLTGQSVALDLVIFAKVVGPALTVVDMNATFTNVSVLSVEPVDDETDDGIDITGGTLTYTGGAISGVADRALILRKGTMTLDGVTVSGGDRAPLTVIDGSTVTATNVTVEKMRIGVFVDEATLVMDASTVRDAGMTCVLTGPMAKVTITDSTMTNCPDSHVAVLGNGVELLLERNDISGSLSSSCISATFTDGSIVMRDNKLSKCAGNGISVSDCGNVLIEGNTITDVTPDPSFADIADGILVLDSTIIIKGNTIKNTAMLGMQVIRSNATIEDNVIESTGSSGISLIEAGTEKSLVKNNKITKAKATGIILLQTQADVIGNEVTGTKFVSAEGLGDGIAFGLGSNVTIQGNTLTSNQTNGIVFLDGAAGSIDGNTLIDNTLYGIREFCTMPANMVTIGSNTFMGNNAGDTKLCSP